MKEFRETIVRSLLPHTILTEAEHSTHGYDLIRRIRKLFGVYLGPSTVYPELHKLEEQGLIESRWEVANGRPRKIYTLTNKGKITLVQNAMVLTFLNKTMLDQNPQRLLSPKEV